MLHAFDRQIQEQAMNKTAEDALIPKLQKLPHEVLRKLATGEVKLADLCDVSGPAPWLARFEGTPLYEQALSLETQKIQRDMQMLQEDAQRDQGWQLDREMNLQRRMLELNLAALKHEQLTGASAAPAAPPAPAKAPPPAAAMALPTTKPTPGAPPPPAPPMEAPPPAEKMGSDHRLEEYVKAGEALARSDYQTLLTHHAGASIGEVMAKQAFIGGLLAKAGPMASKLLASPMAGKAMNFAVKNPGMVAGGLVGAAGGLASGMRKDENGNRSMLGGLASGLGGAALGAGVGAGVQHATGGGSPLSGLLGR